MDMTKKEFQERLLDYLHLELKEKKRTLEQKSLIMWIVSIVTIFLIPIPFIAILISTTLAGILFILFGVVLLYVYIKNTKVEKELVRLRYLFKEEDIYFPFAVNIGYEMQKWRLRK